MSQAVEDELQALESMADDQGLAMQQQADRWNQAEEREEKRTKMGSGRWNQMTAILERLPLIWKRRSPS